MKRLDLVIGPNGSGKTTFITRVLLRQLPSEVTFVNADEIAKQRWPEDPAQHAYEASRLAAATRLRLISAGLSFVAETVFSHPSKLELIDSAAQNGHSVMLHVLLVPEDLAVLRVAARVTAGGHDVPEAKIRERYQRLWPLVTDAVQRCDITNIYDNSGLTGPAIACQFIRGGPITEPSWSAWTPAPLTALT